MGRKNNILREKECMYLNADVNWLPASASTGSQFSNFTFNIFIHLPHHNTRPVSKVYNRFFRRPGFASFDRFEGLEWGF